MKNLILTTDSMLSLQSAAKAVVFSCSTGFVINPVRLLEVTKPVFQRETDEEGEKLTVLQYIHLS